MASRSSVAAGSEPPHRFAEEKRQDSADTSEIRVQKFLASFATRLGRLT